MSTNEPTTKPELMRLQREGRERWEAFLAQIPLERTNEPGVKGKRSVKDIVAHVAAWERHAAERLRSLARGIPPEPLPPGMAWKGYEYAFNARIDEAWRDRSWDEVTAEATAARTEFFAAAEAVPEDVLFAQDKPAWKIGAYNGYLHYLEFFDHISTWLRRKAAGSNS